MGTWCSVKSIGKLLKSKFETYSNEGMGTLLIVLLIKSHLHPSGVIPPLLALICRKLWAMHGMNFRLMWRKFTGCCLLPTLHFKSHSIWFQLLTVYCESFYSNFVYTVIKFLEILFFMYSLFLVFCRVKADEYIEEYLEWRSSAYCFFFFFYPWFMGFLIQERSGALYLLVCWFWINEMSLIVEIYPVNEYCCNTSCYFCTSAYHDKYTAVLAWDWTHFCSKWMNPPMLSSCFSLLHDVLNFDSWTGFCLFWTLFVPDLIDLQ